MQKCQVLEGSNGFIMPPLQSLTQPQVHSRHFQRILERFLQGKRLQPAGSEGGTEREGLQAEEQ
jgi:hypothetical protein